MMKVSDKKKNKKKLEFPTAFTVLFIILIIVAVLTYIVPAGLYAKLEYNDTEDSFVVTDPSGGEETLPASQDTLDDLDIRMDIEKFKDGSIKQSIAIPDTYETIEQQPQGILPLILSPVEGVMDTVDIMVFVLILGGIIGLINK